MQPLILGFQVDFAHSRYASNANLTGRPGRQNDLAEATCKKLDMQA